MCNMVTRTREGRMGDNSYWNEQYYWCTIHNCESPKYETYHCWFDKLEVTAHYDRIAIETLTHRVRELELIIDSIRPFIDVYCKLETKDNG